MTHAEIAALTTYPDAPTELALMPLTFDENHNPLTYETAEENAARLAEILANGLKVFKDSLFTALYDSKINEHFAVDGGVPWLSFLGSNPAKILLTKIVNKEWDQLEPMFVDLDNRMMSHQAAAAASAVVAQKVHIGDLVGKKCDYAYKYIIGYNVARGATKEEIDAMDASFSAIKKALQDKRPDTAKSLLQTVDAGEYSELKAILIDILS